MIPEHKKDTIPKFEISNFDVYPNNEHKKDTIPKIINICKLSPQNFEISNLDVYPNNENKKNKLLKALKSRNIVNINDLLLYYSGQQFINDCIGKQQMIGIQHRVELIRVIFNSY